MSFAQVEYNASSFAGNPNGLVSNQGSDKGLNLVIAKLQELLGVEREQLKLGNFDTLENAAAQKIQLFAQLSKFEQGDLIRHANTDTIENMKSIKASLVENAKLLKLRMEAIGEITDTINTAMNDADSDSTYDVWPAL